MRRVPFFRRLEENARASWVYLACVFIIALLTGACASGDTKQASFEIPPPPSMAELSTSDANETGQASAKGGSENGVTELTRIPTLPITPQEPAEVEAVNSDDYEEECRTIAVTGSRLKRNNKLSRYAKGLNVKPVSTKYEVLQCEGSSRVLQRLFST